MPSFAEQSTNNPNSSLAPIATAIYNVVAYFSGFSPINNPSNTVKNSIKWDAEATSTSIANNPIYQELKPYIHSPQNTNYFWTVNKNCPDAATLIFGLDFRTQRAGNDCVVTKNFIQCDELIGIDPIDLDTSDCELIESHLHHELGLHCNNPETRIQTVTHDCQHLNASLPIHTVNAMYQIELAMLDERLTDSFIEQGEPRFLDNFLANPLCSKNTTIALCSTYATPEPTAPVNYRPSEIRDMVLMETGTTAASAVLTLLIGTGVHAYKKLNKHHSNIDDENIYLFNQLNQARLYKQYLKEHFQYKKALRNLLVHLFFGLSAAGTIAGLAYRYSKCPDSFDCAPDVINLTDNTRNIDWLALRIALSPLAPALAMELINFVVNLVQCNVLENINLLKLTRVVRQYEDQTDFIKKYELKNLPEDQRTTSTCLTGLLTLFKKRKVDENSAMPYKPWPLPDEEQEIDIRAGAGLSV